jgi:hypothetical protein
MRRLPSRNGLVFGYTDDLGVLVAAAAAVAAHITTEHCRHARETMQTWFGAAPLPDLSAAKKQEQS